MLEHPPSAQDTADPANGPDERRFISSDRLTAKRRIRTRIDLRAVIERVEQTERWGGARKNSAAPHGGDGDDRHFLPVPAPTEKPMQYTDRDIASPVGARGGSVNTDEASARKFVAERNIQDGSAAGAVGIGASTIEPAAAARDIVHFDASSIRADATHADGTGAAGTGANGTGAVDTGELAALVLQGKQTYIPEAMHVPAATAQEISARQQPFHADGTHREFQLNRARLFHPPAMERWNLRRAAISVTLAIVLLILYLGYVGDAFNGVLPDFLRHRPLPLEERLRDRPSALESTRTRSEAPCAFSPLTYSGVFHDAL